jgi:hypothetical protein
MIQTETTTPSSQPRTPLRREGAGWLREAKGFRILKVKGSFYEMGRQHGALLSREIADGPVPYFRTYVERVMRGSRLGPTAAKLVFPVIQKMLGRRVARALPGFADETIRGLADGSGISYAELLDGCTMPDSLLWVASRAMQLQGDGPAVAHRLSLGLGCTSAIAWGDATTDGKLYHARNFDYHGVGVWPRTKTIIFHEPEAGQRYVSVAAAGIALGGVTAMNEAGLTLTVHQHMFTDAVRLGGTPIGVVGDIVMREATCIDDALVILEQYRPIGCWTYLVTDGKAREMVCVEESPDRRRVIRSSAERKTFGYANIYIDADLGATEVNLFGSYWRHNQGRYRRVNELLAERAGTLDAEGMAEIIADTGDPRCRVRDSIAMVMTTGSVVFSPEDGVAWVGSGEAPTSHGTFEPFSLAAEDHTPQKGTLSAGASVAPRARDAFERWRRAYVSYVEEDDRAAARRHMAEACALAPEEAVYAFVRGVLALEAGEPGAAEESLDQAIALGHPDEERVAGFHLWRGRARDVLGRRDDACRDYRAALGRHSDPPVHRAARAGLRRAYDAASARRIHVEMSLGDVIAP